MSHTKVEIKTKRIIRLIVISLVAVVFVPVLYSGIYLYAFWDPYGHFDKVPVALVNLDQPVVKDGKEYNIGKDIKDNLKKNKSIGWKFVSYEEAKKGVNGSTYYAMIVIPKDFSQKISEATDGSLANTKIIYEANKGKNYIFAQVSQRAAESIKSEISTNIQKQVTEALSSSLYKVKDSIKEASDGAKQLQDGTTKLVDGSTKLSAGLQSAYAGSSELQKGLKDAANGEAAISAGTDSLIGGLNQFKSSLTQSNSKLPDLLSGAKGVSDGAALASSQVNSSNLQKELTDTANNIANMKTSLAKISSDLTGKTDANSIEAKALADGMLAKINETDKDQKDRITRLTEGATKAGELATSLNNLSSGAKDVSDGMNTLASTLATTQTNATVGINNLIDGANKLKTGSNNLLNGLNTAAQKTAELSEGLNTLNNGALDLKNGIGSVNDGTIKLSDGLSTGYSTISNGLKFNVNDIVKYTTNPIGISDKSINKVKDYGDGLAPYFISLSLWLGAMLMNLIISLTRLSKVVKYKFLKTYTGTFIAGSMLVMLQSIILSLVLVNALGIETSNLALFFIGNMFISVVFFSIMYGISYALGLVGTPIVFILFILQLASSGGTFPIETAPKFYRIVSPLFPMTYTVNGLRMLTSGINYTGFMKIIMVLLTFLVVFYAGGYLSNRFIKGLKNLRADAE